MALETPRDCVDDTIATAPGNETRSFSLMLALRVNLGTAKHKDRRCPMSVIDRAPACG
jgi:hypothetical protein